LIMQCACFKLTDIDGIWYDRYANEQPSCHKLAYVHTNKLQCIGVKHQEQIKLYG
jgi:hypothetical protein